MKDKDPNSTEALFERYFGTSLLKFRNRKIYTELNGDIIEGIPDKDLEQAIRDFTALKIGKDWQNDVKKVPALGPGFSAVYFLQQMDAEVNNGGFNQFFYNCSRDAVLRAKEGAELLGMSALSTVISRALQIEELERQKMAKVKAEGNLEAFFASYKDVSFEAVEEEFLGLNIDFQKAIISFIRSHAELFEGRAKD